MNEITKKLTATLGLVGVLALLALPLLASATSSPDPEQMRYCDAPPNPDPTPVN